MSDFLDRYDRHPDFFARRRPRKRKSQSKKQTKFAGMAKARMIAAVQAREMQPLGKE